MKTSGLESPELGHLKRVRNKEGISSLLLCTSSDPPPLPKDLNLPEPYTIAVPCSAGLTITSVQLKSSLWPTTYAPRRRGETEPWSRGKTRWVWESMKHAVDVAVKGKANGEVCIILPRDSLLLTSPSFYQLPIGVYVPPSFKETGQTPVAFDAHDTRHTAEHPLRHAVLNVIRRIAECRASEPTVDSIKVTGTSTISGSAQDPITHASGSQNGNHYLLTSLTLFTTHEPCIMCSMALLHSRVKEVFYLIPMERTGGCGSVACLPMLEGVNHRFGISQWKQEVGNAFDLTGLALDEIIDA